MDKSDMLFDASFLQPEQLPRKFTARFETILVDSYSKTRVSIDGVQVGDIIDNNSRENDEYRFHDVFHYTFATFLGWSPCTRAMLKAKRKSNIEIDNFEDGARAKITEEAISLMIFNVAKKKFYFEHENKISRALLNQIKGMTTSFEVSARSKEDWENAILTGYQLFRQLKKNNGGAIHYDMLNKAAMFEKI